MKKNLLTITPRERKHWLLRSAMFSFCLALILVRQVSFAQKVPVPCTTDMSYIINSTDATSLTSNDAKMKVSGAIGTTHRVSYSLASGTPSFAASILVPAGGVFVSNLPTPTATTGTDYKIRVYSADSTCFTEKTYTLPYVNFNQTPKFPDIEVTTGVAGGTGGYFPLGSTATVSVTVENKGDTTANNVKLTLNIPAGLTLTGNTPPSGTTYNTGTKEWTIGSVAKGAIQTLTLTFTVGAKGLSFVSANTTTQENVMLSAIPGIAPDTDSQPGNNIAGEDDYGAICISSPFDFCEGDEYRFSITTGNYTGIKWFKGTTEITSANATANGVVWNGDGTITAKSEGIYSYSYPSGTCPDKGCCPIKVEAGIKPQLAPIPDKVICFNGSFGTITSTLSGYTGPTVTHPNGQVKFKWYNAAGAANPTTDFITGQETIALTGAAVPTATGVYKYKLVTYAEDHPNCRDSIYVNLTINALPVPTIASNSPVCEEKTISFTAGGGTQYAWTGPASFASTSDTPSRTNAIEAYEGTYSVTVTNGLSCSASATIAVVVNPKPDAPLVTQKTFCQDDLIASLTTNATALGSHFLQWYGTNSTGGTGSTTAPSHDPVAFGTTLYYVSQQHNTTGCESNRSTLTVLVNPKPAPPITAPVSVCQNSPVVNLAANPGSTGFTLLWYAAASGGTATHIAPNSPAPLTTAVGTTTYFVSKKDDGTGCESNRASLEHTVRPTPVPTIASNSPVCEEKTINFTAGGGTLYSWTGPAAFTSTSDTPSRANAIEAYEGTYIVTVGNGVGCSATISTPVIVNPKPVLPLVTNKVFCAQDLAATLSASALGGNFLQWYGTNSTGGVGSTTNPEHNPVQDGTTLYYVSQKVDATGCESNRSILTVLVNPKPAPPIALDKTYCQGVAATALTANPGSTGFTVLWYGTSSTGGVTTHTGTTGPIPSTVSVGTTTYYVSKKDDVTGCESDRDDAKVVVNATPGAPTTTPIIACELTSQVTLSATASPGNTIMWYYNGTSSTTAPLSVTSNAGMYFVNVTQIIPGTGCESPMASLPVTINPLPVATVIPVNSLCIGAVSQNNAKLILTRYRNDDVVTHYNIGSTISGATLTINSTPYAGGVFASNLPNPTAASDSYTVRIKNSFNCTIDRTVAITKKDCGCPGGYCEPATITKIK